METKICSQCGKQIPAQAKFCTYCGKPTSPLGAVVKEPGKKNSLWIVLGIIAVLWCIVTIVITAVIVFTSDSQINLPGLNRSRVTPTARQADSSQVGRITDSDSGDEESSEIPGIELPDTLVSEIQGTRIQVATDATWPPYESVDDRGDIVGFDIDLMNAIADRVGFQIEYLDISWDRLLAGVASCDYPVAISDITISPDRQELMLFSDPYWDDGQVILTRVDNPEITGQDSLRGQVVAVQIGTAGEEFLNDLQGVEILIFENLDFAVEALNEGIVDAVVTNHVTALGYVGESAGDLHIAGETLTKDLVGIALCQNNSALQMDINRALEQLISEGYVEELIQTWFVKPNR